MGRQGLQDPRRHPVERRSSPRTCPRSRRPCASSSRARRCPAPRNILAAAVEGTQVDIDTAFTIERPVLRQLVTGQVAKNMTKAFFFDLQAISDGASRPPGTSGGHRAQGRRARRGHDGRGHRVCRARRRAWRSCSRTSPSRPPRRARSTPRLVAKAVQRGGRRPRRAKALLDRITPTADPADLAGCDLVIEAVFEGTGAQAQGVRRGRGRRRPRRGALLQHLDAADHHARRGGRPAAGTSSASTSSRRWTRCRSWRSSAGGRRRTPTLARAFDVARQIRKTPIVVNDSRGFFTSRVIGTFLNEGVRDARRGRGPADDRAGRVAGRIPGAGRCS